MDKLSQTLYKFRDIDKFAIDILVNRRLHLSSLKSLNDPHEAVMYVTIDNPEEFAIKAVNYHGGPKRIQELDKSFLRLGLIDDEIISPKICSLSSIWNSNLLWSHYGASHFGIAIGVAFPTLDTSIEKIKVNYDGKVPTITQWPLKKEDVLNALIYKSKEWKHQQFPEVRGRKG